MESEQVMIHFLLVEDDDDHAALMTRSMKRSRIANHVERVRDGAEALDYLRCSGPYKEVKRPDVVLLDLNLPRVSGLSVLEVIKTSDDLKKIPVIVLTTSDAGEDRNRAYSLGANSYVVKPLAFNQFCEMVNDLNQFWGVWNRSNSRDGS